MEDCSGFLLVLSLSATCMFWLLCGPLGFLQEFLLFINEYFTTFKDFCELFCKCGVCGVYLPPPSCGFAFNLLDDVVLPPCAIWTFWCFLNNVFIPFGVIKQSSGFLLVLLKFFLIFSWLFSAVSLNSFCAVHYGLCLSPASLNSFLRIQGALFLTFLQFLLLKLNKKFTKAHSCCSCKAIAFEAAVVSGAEQLRCWHLTRCLTLLRGELLLLCLRVPCLAV